MKQSQQKNYKYKVLLIFVISFVFVIGAKLFYLQILKYKSYAQRAQYSTSRISILVAPRGIIYDRNGNIIATNKQAISVVAYPDKLKTIEEKIRVYELLSRILKSNKTKLKEAILKLPEKAPLPIRLESNIDVKEATLIVEKKHLLPGIEIQKEPIRYYPYGSFAAHALGYISQIDESELQKRPDRKMGDLVGKAGIEKLYDDVLRGKDGKDIVAVDRYGRSIEAPYEHSFIHIEPIPGRNITLTLDVNLQTIAEEALAATMASGGVVVVKPDTGEVLALASYPTYNPNIFTRPISNEIWQSLLTKKAFLNRALLAYTPGSIWKPIVLFAALESKVIKPDEKFKVSEAVYIGMARFGDWTSKTGIYSIQESLAWSRDTAFYQIAQRLTPEQIKEWGVKLGGGRKTGIELIDEEVGIVPDEKWKIENTGEKWYPGNTLHYSIGQGFILVTPLQIARIYSAIANGNKVPTLQLVKQIDKYIKPPELTETYKTDPTTLKIIQEGLADCVEKGTGIASKLDYVKVAGKTGSAEVPGSHKTHGWFSAYAPADNPEILVVALIEKAGHGGSVAAPVVKKVLEAYFSKKEPEVKSNIAEVNQSNSISPQQDHQ